MQIGARYTTHLISFVYLVFTTILYAWSDRADFPVLISVYGVCFFSYVLILYQKNTSLTYLTFIAVFAHLPAFFFLPNLSPDSYRFLWDGAVTFAGQNPFDSTPNELIQKDLFSSRAYFRELFNGLSDLSRANYTCYPTVNQFYFVVANTFSNNITINLTVLKLLILGTQLLGVRYLYRLLQHFGLPTRRLFLILLNPLWLIETLGNLHFEGVMLSFLIIGFYFLVKKKWFPAAIFLALAIHIKLIPLVLLPFLLRYLGWGRSAFVYAATGMIVMGLGWVYLRPDNYHNFLESLQLYFNSFEFNSLIYHHYIQYGYSIYGFFPTNTFGTNLSRIVTFLILCVAFYGGRYDFQKMATRMIFGLLVYYLFATTVHPWYVLTLLGLSVFTRFSFGIVWTGLIFLTYASYGNLDTETLRLLIHLEYAVLILVVGYELIRKRPLLAVFD